MKSTLAVALLLLSAAGAWAQSRPTEILNQGILEEESKHNLAAAVADYEQVVAAFDESRQTAAAALFRLAECQRKLHHDDRARAAYERIVREFADQGRVAELSRTVLAATYKVSPVPQSPVAFAADSQAANARKVYRVALQQSLILAQSDVARVQEQIRLGTAGPEALSNAKERMLKLQRDLAAFDMGIAPER